jgi:predicted transcriptional regulator
MPATDAPPPLHELEAEVMDAMWELASATVREVMDFCNAKAERPRAYTTYMTIMVRLDKKGLLRRKREGKTDVYRTRLDREQYRELRAQADVDKLVGEFGDVALVQFARAMDRLDPARARALRRLARGGD